MPIEVLPQSIEVHLNCGNHTRRGATLVYRGGMPIEATRLSTEAACQSRPHASLPKRHANRGDTLVIFRLQECCVLWYFIRIKNVNDLRYGSSLIGQCVPMAAENFGEFSPLRSVLITRDHYLSHFLCSNARRCRAGLQLVCDRSFKL